MIIAKTMKRRGFTLIELLVVIAIIGVLSSIILATLTSARQKAELSKYNSQKKSIQTAMSLYQLDHDGQYPSTSGSWVCLGPSTITCYNSTSGSDPFWAQVSSYFVSPPTSCSSPGNCPYSFYKYDNPITLNGVTGPFIAWMKLGGISTTECPWPGDIIWNPDYSICYEYIGKY